MSTSQMQFMNEIQAGHDGVPIPEAKRVYFQERLRNRFFEFLLNKFLEQQKLGLTKAKLARRIGKTPDVVNRWLSAPSNLTLDTASDLLLGINAEELDMSASSLLGRVPVNYAHLDEIHDLVRLPVEPVTTTNGTTFIAPERQARVRVR
jgi:transcriptional regulator with XRE-family HTH domain